MEIKLQYKEIEAIALAIADDMQLSGVIRVEIEDTDLEIVCEYNCYIESKREDDYFSGTGSYNITYAEVDIDNIYIDGIGADVIYDENLLCSLARTIIKAA